MGTFEQQAVAQQRLDEIEPAARFAEYQLRKGGKAAQEADIPSSPTTPNIRVEACCDAGLHLFVGVLMTHSIVHVKTVFASQTTHGVYLLL